MSSGPGPSTNPPPARTTGPSSSNKLIVNPNQRGNPILEYVKSAPWEYGETIADYLVGQSNGLLYLSLKYHRLHPEYIISRLVSIQRSFRLRILLCLVDIEDHEHALRELNRACIVSQVSLILAWSLEEAGRYLETFKAFENKPADLIKERVEPDYFSKLTDVLTQVKSVNKTDALTLSSNLGSLYDIIHAKSEDLMLLPGFGENKAIRLSDAFETPFVLPK